MRRRLGTVAAAAVVAVGEDLVAAIGTDPVSLAVAAVVGVVVLIHVLTTLVDDGTIITTADGIGISHIIHATSTSSNSSGRGGAWEVAVGPDEHGVGRFRRAAAAAGRAACVRHIAARFAQPVALLGRVALAKLALRSSPALASVASAAPALPPTASERAAAAAPAASFSALMIGPAEIVGRRHRRPRSRGSECRIRSRLDGRVGKWHASCKFPSRVGWIGLAAVRIEVAAVAAVAAVRRCRSGPRRDECRNRSPHRDVIA